MNYLALDVETANADFSSICQLGIVHFKNGHIVDKKQSLIDPQDYFDPFNVNIHGITEEDVKEAPTFADLYPELLEYLQNQIIVHHMPFDKTAITRACAENDLEPLKPFWLDSAKVARRTWTNFAYKGYGLSNLADYLEIEFDHHDALEDAFAAGAIVHLACQYTQLNVEDWFDRIKKPIFNSKSSSQDINIEGNPEGPLYGENLVFTGSLSFKRGEAGKMAAELGCNVTNSVTQKTTILVVGAQDKTKLAGYKKSSKHRKAEDLINRKKLPIKILSEKDFMEMCNSLDENEKLLTD
jgi:DNA polymerase-3 subunit epsilon